MHDTNGFIYDTGFEDPNTTIKRFWIEYKYDEFEDYYKLKIFPLCKFNNQECSLYYLDFASLNINTRMYNGNVEDAIRDILRINIKRVDDNEVRGVRYSYNMHLPHISLPQVFAITREVSNDNLIFTYSGIRTDDYKFVVTININTYDATAEIYESAWLGSKFCNKFECKIKAIYHNYYGADTDVYEYEIDEDEDDA